MRLPAFVCYGFAAVVVVAADCTHAIFVLQVENHVRSDVSLDLVPCVVVEAAGSEVAVVAAAVPWHHLEPVVFAAVAVDFHSLFLLQTAPGYASESCLDVLDVPVVVVVVAFAAACSDALA